MSLLGVSPFSEHTQPAYPGGRLSCSTEQGCLSLVPMLKWDPATQSMNARQGVPSLHRLPAHAPHSSYLSEGL